MTKWKAWISAARLRTLPLSISGILTGSAAAYTQDSFSTEILVLALATTLGFQILSNFANDYGDGMKGTDNADRVGPARAMQSGLLSAKELRNGIGVTALITLALSMVLIYVSFGTERWMLSTIYLILGIAAIVAAVKYTVGKSAYGYRAMGDLFVFVFFGLVGVAGCYFLYTQSLSVAVFLLAATIGLLSAAVLNLNNMRDRAADAAVNKITLAVVLGKQAVKHYHAALILVALACSGWYFYTYITDVKQLLPMIAFVPILINLIKVYKTEDATKLDPELKKVALSTFLFSLLFFLTVVYL